MSDKWYANYNVDLRDDTSKLTSSTGINDSSAFKVKLTNSNLLFLSEDKSRILLPEAALTVNNAKGK
ncbi:MAG: hypothetical protein V4692_16630, partial [Bdellovibrionota bacterium]